MALWQFSSFRRSQWCERGTNMFSFLMPLANSCLIPAEPRNPDPPVTRMFLLVRFIFRSSFSLVISIEMTKEKEERKMNLTNKNILVTGGSGFLGSAGIRQLLASGIKNENIFVPRSHHCDLRKEENCHRAISGQDVVIHLAGH